MGSWTWSGRRGDALNGGDDVDFYARVLGQPRGLNRRARRGRVAEIATVDLVHDRKIVHIRQVDGRPHDLVERRSRRLEDGFEVREHAVRLRRDVALDEGASSRV